MHVAGIDAHTSYVVVTVLSPDGSIVHPPTRIRNQDVDRLRATLCPFEPLEIVVEASPSWPWIYDLLDGPGSTVILAHPKRLRAIAETNYKTDALDATLLARMRLVDLIPEAYCKPIEQREQATLVRHRARLVRLRTQAAARIHAELHAVGVHMPRGRLLTRPGRAFVHDEVWPLLGPEQQHAVRNHERIIDGVRSLIKRLDRRIDAMGREIPAVGLLQTIPGVGPYRALLIATEALPIDRFRTPAHLVSYAGLAPRSARSGQSVRYGPIPAGANRWLRHAFVQAAVNHHRHAPDSWLSLYYKELKDRLDWRVARIAMARKLARCVHAMLRSGEVWRHA